MEESVLKRPALAQVDGEASPPAIQPVYLENTLLRIFGVLFCHDPKRARERSGTIAVHQNEKDKSIVVRLDSEYAQPGPFAHKVAMAIIRKHSRYGRPAQKAISFSQRELIRFTGRKTWGGRQSAELALALKQIRYTHVLAHFKTGDRFVEHDFSIFDEVMLERRSSHTDPIVACTVMLADPIIQSLNDRHFTCLNHTLMQQLGTIGQALMMRLFFHFANHYERIAGKKGLAFSKRYDDICAEWLGGLTVLKHKSKIIGEQLGGHLDALVQVGFLSSYTIAPAEVRDGFVLTFRPGEAFFADYRRFYSNRFQGDLQFEFHDEARGIGEPHRVAYLFAEKRIGKPGSIPFVSSKDVDTAKEFLAHVAMTEMPEFLDYAIAEARRTRFEPQTLGGIKQYLTGYLQGRESRAAAKAMAAARHAEHQEMQARTDYSQYRRAAADRLFDHLPPEEQAEIDALARATTSHRPHQRDGFIARTLFGIERARIITERHPDKISSFEHWKARNHSLL